MTISPDGDATRLIGSIVTGVHSSWYVDRLSEERSLVHVWIDLDGSPVKLSVHSGVWLHHAEIYEPAEMPDTNGRLEVLDTAGPLCDQMIGERITQIGTLKYSLKGASIPVGWLIECADFKVAFMDLADDLVIERWPLPDRLSPVISI